MKRARRPIFSPVFVWGGVTGRRRPQVAHRCGSHAVAGRVLRVAGCELLWVVRRRESLALRGLIGAQDHGDIHVSWV